MEAILSQTSSVLASEGAARIDGFDIHDRGIDQVRLSDITAVAGFGLPIGLLIAFSFEPELLETVLGCLTADNPVSEAERPLFLRETAAELVNTVLGLCTSDFHLPEATVSLSPPVILEGERSILRMAEAVFASMDIFTDKGAVHVNLIGPRDLFDDRLNYRH
ncbi:MAG: chemotaxis protein CheX [Magnetospirillum sp.]|nr:chemotaxis protein CheX [Magnetospirillum sp.]